MLATWSKNTRTNLEACARTSSPLLARPVLLGEVARREQVAQADPAKKLSPDAVQDCVANFRTVLSRVNVHSEGSLAKRSINDLHDGVRHSGDICIGRDNGREAFEHLVRKASIGTCLICNGSQFIARRSCMREVVYGELLFHQCAPPKLRALSK